MKNLLIISAVFPPEPVVSASLSFDIANKLADDNRVTVISPKPTRPFGFKFDKQFKNQKFKHFQLNSYTCSESKLFGRLRESYSFGKYSYKYIFDNHKQIDLVYINTWPLFAGYFTVKAAKQFNIPVINHVQDIYPESLSNKLPVFSPLVNFLLLPIDKYILKNASKIIAISNNMKEYLAQTRGIEKEKIEVVQNWQDENSFIEFSRTLRKISGNNNPFTFMYLGNIGPVAGIDILVEAFSSANIKNSRLVIAGSGSMKETLQRKVVDQHLKAIEFWDVPDGKVPEIQDQADVMLLPIKKGAASSSVPSKLPAYMFSKKAIISCVDENSATASVIKSSNCGWVLPPENSNALAEKLIEVVVFEKSILFEMGMNGFNYALNTLSKKNNLNKLINILITKSE